jgi:hypothetical protein
VSTFGRVIVALGAEIEPAALGAATIQHDRMNPYEYIRSIIIKSLDSLEY